MKGKNFIFKETILIFEKAKQIEAFLRLQVSNALMNKVEHFKICLREELCILL
jgi:hypothetical protein